MTDWSRRAFLASGVAGLSAIAGCSSIPVLGESDDHPSYDYQRLRDLADPEAVPDPSMYPAPVPDALAEAHYERGRALLDGVPAEPSFPNEVVTNRLTDQREHAAEAFADPPGDDSSVGALSAWRYDRGTAAEVHAAYDAASGDLTRADVADRRSTVREELASFRNGLTYRGESVFEVVAVHRQLERLAAASRRSLVGHRRLPEDLQTAVFDAGEVVGGLEEGRAAVADAAGLRDAYVTDGMEAHVDAVATAASRLEGVFASTLHNVGPDIDRRSSMDDFHRELEETPAAELFRSSKRAVVDAPSTTDASIERGDYATGVVTAGRTLVEVVAAGVAVEAIRNGEHGQPESTEEIVGFRERAVDAVDDTLAVDPAPVAVLVSWPARRALRYAEIELAGRENDPDYAPDHRDTVQAVGQYAFTEYLADAVPSVVDRVVAELEGP